MSLSDQERVVLGRFYEARAAMGRVALAAERWCETFDAGDAAATRQYYELLVEALTDYGDAVGKVQSAVADDTPEAD